MFRLIVSDDDAIIRESLKTRFDWARMGFQVVGAMEDGSDVIAYLKKFQADAILTDIRMYQVSGLDVARYVQENHLPVKIILLSGYQDFEYAQQGIQYGVFDYILKPIDPAKVESTFRRLAEELKKRKKLSYTAAQEEQLLRLLDCAVRYGTPDADGRDEDCPSMDPSAPDASGEARAVRVGRCFRRAVQWLHAKNSPLSEPMESFRQLSETVPPDESIRVISELLGQRGIPLPLQTSAEIEHAKKYMSEHLALALSADLVAREVHLSTRQLIRRFTAEVGKTYGEYLLWLRMTLAEELLTGAEKPDMDEICIRTGFTDVKYFKKVFRSYFGCLPKEYLNRNQHHE